jgi:hypothetical protein
MFESNSMREVWRWKEEVARDTEGMSMEEELAFFRQSRERLAKKIGSDINVRQVTRRSMNRRIGESEVLDNR